MFLIVVRISAKSSFRDLADLGFDEEEMGDLEDRVVRLG